MQTDDGTFEQQYDADTGKRSTPRHGPDVHMVQARGALALALAGSQLDRPAYLAAARRALDAVPVPELPDCTAHEARWLAEALLALNAVAPDSHNAEAMGRIAAVRRAAQLTADGAPWPDFAGATLDDIPPLAEATANDLVVFATACMMDAPEREANLAAARLAAQYVMHCQFLPENSYYLDSPAAPEGGFREKTGGNIIRMQTVEAALRGLTALTDVEMQEREGAD
jgi:hypothetical protein